MKGRVIVVTNHDGLEVTAGGRTRVLPFSQIATVVAEKVGKVTYDEVFLIIYEHSGEGVAIGELDEGFADAGQALRARLSGLPSDWWASAEQAAIGVRELVWSTTS